MIIELNGIYGGLRFSAAHIVFGHESCGVIHGHSYYIDVKLSGEQTGQFNFVCDFKVIKNIVKELANEMDHKLLVPKYHPEVKYEIKDDYLFMEYNHNGTLKKYMFPCCDVLMLPLKSTTAEEMSEYFGEHIKNGLDKLGLLGSIEWIETTVNEGIGQGARSNLLVK
ncbi:6-pyruvoyltetrahydropterin/6-carboxytetrahydropterin synthase [Methanococcus voltae]|uniref:6-carboxytetrahydropterin synthase n=1 Tax=Methanococcus voltae TaxID=2188 RepID=UPI001AE3EC41|nr:6-carboxytetrahydropterin synthase [Methanococcus voltae]MBP2144029.1 6-pyruvoyltetrahydropterin/6-carboxytetrahydropterin synthase [Methanococcus voltae]